MEVAYQLREDCHAGTPPFSRGVRGGVRAVPLQIDRPRGPARNVTWTATAHLIERVYRRRKPAVHTEDLRVDECT